VADRIRREVDKGSRGKNESALPPYTVSLGVAVANTGEGDCPDLETLLAHADAALYRAKQGGRNRVES
jgi:diguanylate cyclase (GGDEF)-like protein